MKWTDIPTEYRSLPVSALKDFLAGVTKKNITVSQIVEFLEEEGLCEYVFSNTGNRFEGPLVTYAEDASTPDAVKNGLDKFLGFLSSGHSHLRCRTKPAIAGETITVINLLLLVNQFSVEQADRFWSLGGGRLCPDASEATIQAAKDKFESDKLTTQAHDKFNSDVDSLEDVLDEGRKSFDHDTMADKLEEAATLLRSLKGV